MIFIIWLSGCFSHPTTLSESGKKTNSNCNRLSKHQAIATSFLRTSTWVIMTFNQFLHASMTKLFA